MAKRTLDVDSAELYQHLDNAGGPVKNAKICQDLNWSEGRLHDAKKNLLRARSIYATQEGIVLQKYATTEQQIWHLGWCIGLFETAGIHVTMDKELLLDAPKAFQQLIDDGKFRTADKLLEFRQRVIQTMELPKQLIVIYNQVNQIIENEIKFLKAKEELKEKFKKD